jgi:predicted PurR-regulated permease PerM
LGKSTSLLTSHTVQLCSLIILVVSHILPRLFPTWNEVFLASAARTGAFLSDGWHRKHMSFFDKRTVSVLSTIVLFTLVAGFIYGARRILIVFLFAVLFAYLLEPLVSLVQRQSKLSRGSRSLAIFLVYVFLLLIISGVILGIGPRVADEGRKLASALPALLDQMSSGRFVAQIGGKHGWSFDTQSRIQQFFAAHRAAIIAWASDFGGRATMLLANTVWLIVIPILATFFLRDARGFADSIIQAAERSRQRQFLSSIVEDLNAMLAGYIRAQLVLAGLSLVVYTVGLLVLRAHASQSRSQLS